MANKFCNTWGLPRHVWQELHPNFARDVHELEQVSDGDWAWCDVTVTARFSDLTGTAYFG
jgi:hypothetical protein